MGARAGYGEYLAKGGVSTHEAWCEYLAQGTEAKGAAKALAEETLVPRGLVYSKSIRARVRIIGVRVRVLGVRVPIIGVRVPIIGVTIRIFGVTIRMFGVRVRAGVLGEHPCEV